MSISSSKTRPSTQNEKFNSVLPSTFLSLLLLLLATVLYVLGTAATTNHHPNPERKRLNFPTSSPETQIPAPHHKPPSIKSILMLPTSTISSPVPDDDNNNNKPKTLPSPPPPPLLSRKDSFSSLKPYLPRTWLILTIFLLQILLLLASRSIPVSTTSFLTRRHFPSPAPTQCPSGKVYVYSLPPLFNIELLQNCHELNPWASRCHVYSNEGFGRSAADKLTGVVPHNLTHAWFWTDQFASEIIFHNRMMNYRCRTLEPESATAFYIPFYAGLAVGKYLFTDNYTPKDRDRLCEMMLNWVHNQPYWDKSDGWDHFITMGRITWDFRRSKDQDWGSSCIYLPGMRNITRLLIERNSWDYFDVGVPYPTGFHPNSAADVTEWQDFTRARNRTTLYCFAGATRGFIKNDFRGILLSQCYNDSSTCRVVDCGGSKCSNGTTTILETFLDSDFCLQPRGDSFTRRSIFDCMIAGSIPVFFWNRTAYSQYDWFLPGEPGSYSVFIDRNEVKNGKSIREVLQRIGKDKVKKMREKVIEYVPNIVYARPGEGLKDVRDAFDIAVEGVLRRVKQQEEVGYKW